MTAKNEKTTRTPESKPGAACPVPYRELAAGEVELLYWQYRDRTAVAAFAEGPSRSCPVVVTASPVRHVLVDVAYPGVGRTAGGRVKVRVSAAKCPGLFGAGRAGVIAGDLRAFAGMLVDSRNEMHVLAGRWIERMYRRIDRSE